MNWLENAEKYKEMFISDLRGVIKIPSLRNDAEAREGAPFGEDVRKALDYMMELGKRDGFKVSDVDGYACVIEYGEGDETLGVLGHLDVVPLGEGWTKDPLGGEIVDGYMFGRGVLDDKGPGMAAYYALKMLKDSGTKLNKRIMLIYGCDEETGMGCMDYYVEHAEVPQMGFVPDADFPVIYGEKGGLHLTLDGDVNTIIDTMECGSRPNIVIGRASAIVNAKLDEASFNYYLKAYDLVGSAKALSDTQTEYEIEGSFSHAAWAYKGVNAALHLFNFIGTSYDDSFAKKTYELLKDWQGASANIDFEGAYMGFLTMSLGIVEIKNGHANLLLDIRYPNDTNGDELFARMSKRLTQMQYPLELKIVKDGVPLFVDPNSDLVKTLHEVYVEYSGDTFTPDKTIGGGTYARKIPNFVAFGPEFPGRVAPEHLSVGGPHQKDEGILVDDLMKAIAIYAGAIEKLGR